MARRRRPGAFTSTASCMAQRRLERAQGRASERGPSGTGPRRKTPGGGSSSSNGESGSASAAANRGKQFRTLGELKAIGFTQAHMEQVLEARAKLPEPPTGDAADPGLVSLTELKEMGYRPGGLVKAGFPPKMLKEHGYSLLELLENKGYARHAARPRLHARGDGGSGADAYAAARGRLPACEATSRGGNVPRRPALRRVQRQGVQGARLLRRRVPRGWLPSGAT